MNEQLRAMLDEYKAGVDERNGLGYVGDDLRVVDAGKRLAVLAEMRRGVAEQVARHPRRGEPRERLARIEAEMARLEGAR
jgi:hypothetical protein